MTHFLRLSSPYATCEDSKIKQVVETGAADQQNAGRIIEPVCDPPCLDVEACVTVSAGIDPPNQECQSSTVVSIPADQTGEGDECDPPCSQTETCISIFSNLEPPRQECQAIHTSDPTIVPTYQNGSYEAVWWDRVASSFEGTHLKRCWKRRDMPPSEGQVCSRASKTCYFLARDCGPDGGLSPGVRCLCSGEPGEETWHCSAIPCPVVLDATYK